MSEGNDYEFLAGSAFASPGALLIVVGCITFIVTAIGILGAACKSQILLIIVSSVCKTSNYVAGTRIYAHVRYYVAGTRAWGRGADLSLQPDICTT